MNIPKHIAVIMDGNGRWAKKRLLPPIAGHKKGVSAVRKTVKQCATLGVEVLTLFAFSSENKNRPQTEIAALFSLFLIALKKEIKKLDKANIQFKVIGDLSIFSDELIQMIKKSEEQLDKNTGLTLVIAANYGGKWDIVQASKKIAKDIESKTITFDDINENNIATKDDVLKKIREDIEVGESLYRVSPKMLERAFKKQGASLGAYMLVYLYHQKDIDVDNVKLIEKVISLRGHGSPEMEDVQMVTKKELEQLKNLAYKYSNKDDKISIYETLSTRRFGKTDYIDNYALIF
jgi:undecaprenyl diphosphate synthase